MTSCCRRLGSGAVATERPVRFRQYRPAVISRFPRNRGMEREGMVLRLAEMRYRRVEWAMGAGGGGRGWERSEAGGGSSSKEGGEKKVGSCSYAVDDQTAAAAAAENLVGRKYRAAEEESVNRTVEVTVAAAMTVALGVGNRVLYKLALIPLKHYPFFLAQLATFGYVVVYFSILYVRYHAGIVTDEMLSMPKAPFLAVGLLEALAAVTGMAAGAILSGASIPILSQTYLVWQIILSIIFLGRRYKVNQLLGCFLVAVGVIITVASGSGAGHSLKDAGIFWSLMMIASFLLQAADTVLKEVIFLDGARKLKGSTVDIFVVNSFGSAYQAVFIFMLLPFLSKLWGIPFGQLPNYIRDGTACFLNIGTLSNGCDGAPLLPVLFVIVNMGYNISLLHLLKISSAVVSSLASTFSVPISVFMFTLPLPYLGVASTLPTGFVAGVIVLVMGLLIYARTPSMASTDVSSPSSI
ncbi:protein CLT1, chloroplastic [Ziziphus jujuba]|uniref:Protein CLT1, chloroplastic n=1 Tax=Ziziphus jujuba TaxID=326968 RepID=A0A6P3Z8H7_ZIZJJ|nr:protein CLT1, chloroplastic [Ziziphus jujuba]